MVYNTITYASCNRNLVCWQLNKRMRSKMGSAKLYVHSNYAIRNNDWIQTKQGLLESKLQGNFQLDSKVFLICSWQEQFPIVWPKARTEEGKENGRFTFSRVSCLSPRDIHIASAQNKQDHCIQHAYEVGHVWTGDLLAATCQVVIPARAQLLAIWDDPNRGKKQMVSSSIRWLANPKMGASVHSPHRLLTGLSYYAYGVKALQRPQILRSQQPFWVLT